MPYFVQELIEEKQVLSTVTLHDRVQVALDKMFEHDFSQLPVIDGEERPVGLITSESILAAQRNFGIGLDNLLVQHARMDADEFRDDADLFELLDRLRERYAVLIVDGTRKLIGIVTNYDTAAYFRRRAEDMMLVEDIESMLKDYIQAAYALSDGSIDEERLQGAIQQRINTVEANRRTFRSALSHYISLQTSGNPALDSDLLQQVLDTHYDETRGVRAFSDLTFYEYMELLLSEELWHRYRDAFKLDRAAVRTLLDSVRVIRNALAHFHGEILPIERERLRFCANWLAQYQDAITAQFGLNDQTEDTGVELHPTVVSASSPVETVATEDALSTHAGPPAEDEVAPDESRYAPLAVWLQNQPADKDLVKPKFAKIEEIIGEPLPSAAYRHRSWWANDSVSHAQSQQWLGVDWRVSSVSLTSQTVRFTRMKERQKAYIEFFNLLFTEFRAKAEFDVPHVSPDGASWITFSRISGSGASAASFAFSFTRGKRFRVELYIDTGEQASTKSIFDLLHARQEELQVQLGDIGWERLNTKRASRIAMYHAGAITDDEETLAELRQWATDTMIKFYGVVKPLAVQAIEEVMQA